MTFTAEMQEKARQALAVMSADPALGAAITKDVDIFFARFPEIERTELTAGFIASLALERLSAGTDSQSAPASNAETQTQKVA